MCLIQGWQSLTISQPFSTEFIRVCLQKASLSSNSLEADHRLRLSIHFLSHILESWSSSFVSLKATC